MFTTKTVSKTLATIGLLCGTFMNMQSANAVMLSGYAQKNDSTNSTYSSPVATNTTYAGYANAAPSYGTQSYAAPTLTAAAYASSTTGYSRPTYTASVYSATHRATPADFVGTWRCYSRVLESGVAGVMPGTTVECTVNFQRNANGDVIATWYQDGWTPSTSAVVKFGGSLPRISHTNALRTGCSWAAHSEDTFRVISSQQLFSVSEIAQYERNQFVGTYRTQSTLQRI